MHRLNPIINDHPLLPMSFHPIRSHPIKSSYLFCLFPPNFAQMHKIYSAISNPPLNFHQQKDFLPISNHSNHNHNNMNRPHSTSQTKSFKFDDNVMSHIQISNNISNVSNQSMHSDKHISKTNNNTPQTQQSQPQLPSPSPTQQ